jgi:hypothetical protein
MLLLITIPPPPGGTAILPEYIHYYGYYYQVIVQYLPASRLRIHIISSSVLNNFCIVLVVTSHNFLFFPLYLFLT